MPNMTYRCELCEYDAGNKKSNYEKHLISKKHLKKANGDNMSDTSDITDTTEYCEMSTLSLSRNP